MKPGTIYTTSDGKTFTHAFSAKLHEEDLKKQQQTEAWEMLTGMLTNTEMTRQDKIELFNLMIGNKEEFQRILNKL